jgi:hypothetical protein
MSNIYFPPYRFWKYSLRTARTDEPLGLAGSDLIVYKNPSLVEIRLDDIRNDRIPIGACEPTTPITITGIPFKEIYLTNDASDGNPYIQFMVLFGGSSVEILEELQKPKGLDRLFDKMGLLKQRYPQRTWEMK